MKEIKSPKFIENQIYLASSQVRQPGKMYSGWHPIKDDQACKNQDKMTHMDNKKSIEIKP